MARALNPSLLSSVERNGSEPFVIVEMQIPYVATFSVNDYNAAASSNVVLRVNRSVGTAGNITVQEGVDFDAELSNIVTAANLEEALSDALDFDQDEDFACGIFREDGTNQVHFWSSENQVTSIVVSGSGVGVSRNPSGVVRFASGTGYDGRLSDYRMDGVRIDPITREFSVGTAEALIEDCEAARVVFSAFALRYAPITIKIGEPSTFATEVVGSYLLDDFTYSPDGFRVRMVDASGVLAASPTFGEIHGMHPLSAIARILSFARMPNVDFSTFELSNVPANQRALCVSRINGYEDAFDTTMGGGRTQPLIQLESGGDEQAPAWDYVNEILQVYPGTVYVDHGAGDLKFRPYSVGASENWTINAHDISGFEHVSSMDNQVRRSLIDLYPIRGQRNQTLYQDERALRNTPGSGYGLDQYVVASPYITALGRFYGGGPTVGQAIPLNYNTGADWHLIKGAPSAGFSCSHRRLSGGTWTYVHEPEQITASGLPEGVMICKYRLFAMGEPFSSVATDENPVEVAFEWIALEPVAWSTSDPVFPAGNATSVAPSTRAGRTLPGAGKYQVVTSFNDFGFSSGRTGFGGSQRLEDTPVSTYGTMSAIPTAFGQGNGFILVEDHTLAFHVGQVMLDRFRYGAPIVRFKLPLQYVGIEIGDVLAFEDFERFVGFGMKNALNATWEVVSIQHILAGPGKGVSLECALLRRYTQPEVFFDSTLDPDSGSSTPTDDEAQGGGVTTTADDPVVDSSNDRVVVD